LIGLIISKAIDPDPLLRQVEPVCPWAFSSGHPVRRSSAL